MWLLFWQNDLSAAGDAAASALMTLERHDNEAVAHRVVGLRQVDDAAVGGPC
jgi:hypothetical protein